MNFLVDKEVNLKKEDQLNSKSYADTLEQMVISAPIDSCFTIGLFGEWGSGKSSIVKTVQETLEADAKKKIKFIVYDAWKYSNDSFRRMFLMKVKEDLNFTGREKFKSFYTNKATDITVDRKIDKKYLWVSLIIFAVGIFIVRGLRSTDAQVTLTIIVSALGLLVSWLGKAFNDHKITLQEPLTFAPEQFEECFDEMISLSLAPKTIIDTIQKWVEGDNYASGMQKIVIVIDNIDRCAKETSYELITNIKNFLGKRKNIVFLIPVDDEALKKHITKGGLGNHKEAEEFLRKFFNVTLRIKPFKSFDLYDLANSINKRNGFNLNPDTIDIISKEYATNPRRIIQFFNNLISELNVFSNKYGTAFITQHESLICKSLILREEWPEYYKWISKNPHLLISPDGDLNTYLADANHSELNSFLNITNSINQNTSYDIIETILSPHNRKLKIPIVVLNALTKKELDIIKQSLEDKLIDKQSLVDALVEMLDTGIKQGSYQTNVNNVVEIICNLDKWDALLESDNRRIYDRIHPRVFAFIKYINNFDIFCEYARHIVERFAYLDKNIKMFFEDNISGQNNELDYAIAKKLFIAYLKTLEDPSLFKDITATFLKDYKRANWKFKDYPLPVGKIRLLIDQNVINYLAGNLKEVTPDDATFSELVYLGQTIDFMPAELETLFGKINEIYPSFNNIQKDALSGIIININTLIGKQKPVFTGKDRSVTLPAFVNKFAAPRSVAGISSIYTNETMTDIELDQVISFLFAMYRITNESLEIQETLRSIIEKNATVAAYVRDGFLEMVTQYGFKLSAVKQIIWNDSSYSENGLALFRHLFYVKDGDKYVIGDDEAKEQLTKFLSLTINGNVTIKDFLDSIMDEERLTKLLTQIVETYDRENILRLSHKLQYLAFDTITQGDNIFSYENDVEMLKLMSDKGNMQHIGKVVNVIVSKLQREEKIEEALDILEEVSRLEQIDINRISGEIENIRNMDIKNEAREILANKFDRDKTPVQKGLKIIRVIYKSGKNFNEVNVTRKVRKLVSDNALTVTSSNDIVDGNDPHVGEPKELIIDYGYDGDLKQVSVREGTSVTLP